MPSMQIKEAPLNIKAAPERWFWAPLNVKLALDRQFSEPLIIKLALDWWFGAPLNVKWHWNGIKLALERWKLAFDGSGALVGRALGPFWGKKILKVLSTI